MGDRKPQISHHRPSVARLIRGLRATALGALLVCLATFVEGGQGPEARPSLHIPRIEGAPSFEDFAGMGPSTPLARSMTRVEGFRQWRPRDGNPVSQRTEAYLGYGQSHLYVVFVCFDSEPEKIRARLAKREDTRNDDGVDLFLDTFNDQLRGYAFSVNPLGVQRDATWVEGGSGSSRYNMSFDTVWDSGGTLTPEGYVAWMAIPFRSLRFSPAEDQEWGILLRRQIRRENEYSFWPYVTTRIEGRLNQAAALQGISDVSPGRNMQLIPYGFFRSFRALDTSDEENPQYVTDSAELDGGVDFKTVFRDSLVLDLTANPDFNQVESDEPQVTVNQRFEVFFPERRPFFLENASYFETPINLFFSRRIVEPQLGVRLTGKAGPYAVGALFANDRSPELEDVPADDPVLGEKSQNAVLRVSRDVGNQSSIGAIYTDARLEDSYNRVGGLDARVRFNSNWIGTFQGVASSTRLIDGEELSGPAFDAVVQRAGRKLEYEVAYNDRSPGFFTALGFLPGSRGPSRPGRPRNRALLLRPDFRGVRQTLSYRFRPEGDVLISWGPDVTLHPSWRHDSSALDTVYSLDMTAELMGRTFVGAFHTGLVERLRPEEFPGLSETTRYDSARTGVFGSSSISPIVTFSGEYAWGTVINLVAPEDVAPPLANSTQGTLTVRWFVTRSIRLEGTYLLARVSEASSSRRVFDNHIGRARLSWQPTPRLTLRSIVEYNAITADPALTTLETEKNLNMDFLATYLVDPWTAVYVGYNNNQNSFRLVQDERISELVPGHGLGPDSWQFFVKISYLLRF